MKACDAVQELLAAHLLRSLDDREEALVDEHLTQCGGCRASREETSACLDAIAAPPVAPPPAVWQGLVARLERQGGDDPVRDASPDPVISVACSYCRGAMTRVMAVYCASCLAPHHRECFAEHGRCSVMGCGETKVVRPADLPAPPAPAPAPLAPPLPARRGAAAWVLLGLVCAGAGAGAALSLRERGPAELVPRQSHDRSAPGDALFQVDVSQATLGEVVARLAEESGARVSLPPGAAHLLLRSGSWRRRAWIEVLEDLAARHGLRVESREPGRYELTARPGFVVGPEAPPSWIDVDRTVYATLAGEQATVWEGFEQEVLAAPRGEGVAVLGRERLYVFAGGQQLGSTSDPVHAAAWSGDGRDLCYVKRTAQGTRLGLFHLDARRSPDQRDLRHLPDDLDERTQVVWLEGQDAMLVRTAAALCKVDATSGQVVSLSAPCPAGYGRFDIRALKGGRFLLELPERVEVWRCDGRVKLVSSYPVARDYRTVTAPGASHGLVITSTEILSFPVEGSPHLTPHYARQELGRTWAAALSPDGARLAFIDSGEPWLCSLREPTAADVHLRSPDLQEGNIAGVAWNPTAESVAYWSDRLVYEHDALHPGRSPRRVFDADTGAIRSVTWSGSYGLLVTIRARAERAANVRVVRVD
ncbi:MAG: zf-HC2 domain-containing protein [Planctomycetota bacterium]